MVSEIEIVSPDEVVHGTLVDDDGDEDGDDNEYEDG